MSETGEREAELLNARYGQPVRADALCARENSQFKLRRSMSQEFRNGD
jgi:hypothetical protein